MNKIQPQELEYTNFWGIFYILFSFNSNHPYFTTS